MKRWDVPKFGPTIEDRGEIVMITYEEIVNELVTSMKNCGLYTYNIQQNLEIITLYREFKCNAVVADLEAPYLIRAEIEFGWDSTLTVASIYGNDCGLYHNEEFYEPDDELDSDNSIELNICYDITVKKGFVKNSNYIHNELLNLFDQVMEHGNIPDIRWEVTTNGDVEAFISSITAEHYRDIDILNKQLDLEGIFLEVKDVLEGLMKLPFIKNSYHAE